MRNNSSLKRPRVITPAQLRIGLSTIPGGGRGVFALTDIVRGTELHVTGFRVPAGSLADQCTHFADPYKFRVGKSLLIPTGYAGLINHSRRPNLVKVTQGQNVFLRALHTIQAGEELFHAYGPDALRRFRRKPA